MHTKNRKENRKPTAGSDYKYCRSPSLLFYGALVSC